MADFRTEHGLDFEVAPWEFSTDPMNPFTRFRIGTCDGLWRCKDGSYEILAIENSQKGNGHLTDVLQWFENSCRRDGRTLKILEVWNTKFKAHLIGKRSFTDIGNDNVELRFE